MERKTIVIGIPTFRRPLGLKSLLNSISKLKSIDASVIVVVADNEGPAGAGLTVVDETKQHYFPFELIGIPVPDTGISQVRNALLQYAFGTLEAIAIAMVDDDEIVHENWLYELYRVLLAHGSDVVGSAVYPKFTCSAPSWTDDLIYYWRPIHPTGPISIIQGTTSVMLSRTIWDKFCGTLFDIEYSKSGGGDKEFFTRLKLQGAKFSYAAESISYEIFDSSRVDYHWAKQRAFRIGNGDSRNIIKNKGYLNFLIFEVPKLIMAYIHNYLKLFLIRDEDKKKHAELVMIRQVGKINGLFGRTIDVYSNTHGK